jgi:lysophospholipase L1-like esterase
LARRCGYFDDAVEQVIQFAERMGDAEELPPRDQRQQRAGLPLRPLRMDRRSPRARRCVTRRVRAIAALSLLSPLVAAAAGAGDAVAFRFAFGPGRVAAGYTQVLESTVYTKEQLTLVIDETRAHGATPVLVTSMPRRRFDSDGTIVNTLGDYPEATRQTAKEEGVALVDLFTAAKTLFEALGPDASRRAFVHYPAGTFPGQDEELKDDTHFNAYGAYELAHPDPVEGWNQSRE